MAEIRNYLEVDDWLATAGQPSEEQLSELAGRGFDVVIAVAIALVVGGCHATGTTETPASTPGPRSSGPSLCQRQMAERERSQPIETTTIGALLAQPERAPRVVRFHGRVQQPPPDCPPCPPGANCGMCPQTSHVVDVDDATRGIDLEGVFLPKGEAAWFYVDLQPGYRSQGTATSLAPYGIQLICVDSPLLD